MNKQGNTYTFIYSIILVVVVAAILAIVSLSLKPYQDENIENEKRQNILSSVNVSSTPETSAELFNKIITKQFILNYKETPSPWTSRRKVRNFRKHLKIQNFNKH